MDFNIKTASLVAAALGTGWTAREDKDDGGRVWGWTLLGPEEQTLTIGTMWRDKDRLTISGKYPHEIDANGQSQDYGAQAVRYNETRPSITVSASKAPAAIAGDIKRRLMPEYLRILTEAKRRREDHRKYVAETLSVMDRLAKVCPEFTKLCKSHSGGETYLNITGNDHEFYGDIKVHGSDTVTINLRGASPEVAETLLWALSLYGTPKETPCPKCGRPQGTAKNHCPGLGVRGCGHVPGKESLSALAASPASKG